MLVKKFPLLLSIIFISFLFFINFAEAEVTIDNPLIGGGIENLGDLIAGITIAIAKLAGAIAGLMFVLGGFYLLTSTGDPAKIQKGKDFLKYAIIGTVIALAAAAIVELAKSWMRVS